MRRFAALFLALAGLSSTARAEDAYYDVAIKDLEIVEGALPKPGGDRWFWPFSGDVFLPRLALDDDGEGYVEMDPGTPFGDNFGDLRVGIRLSDARDATGWIFLPQLDERRMVKARFRVPAAKAQKDATRFFSAKRKHYEWLLSTDASGAAWFRHRLFDVRGDRPADTGRIRRDAEQELARTYDLFTGGRAVSENLQLDRVLPGGVRGAETVALDSLEGISVKALDWKPYLEGLKSEADPLARLIPNDQLGLFFPGFEAMTRLMDAADESGTPILHAIETRTEDARTRQRYERQLCLRTDALSRLLGPELILSVAFTAGDPFLRTGSDVAILFEAKDEDALFELLRLRRGAAASDVDGVEVVKGDAAGVAYEALVSPARRVSSYMAKLGTAVVVANSLRQIERILAAGQQKAPSLAGEPEYAFFRGRYARGAGETAFLVLPDAAIRRWCSARWRIGESRRVRADAALAELDAEAIEALATGEPREGLDASWSPVDLGPLERTPAGIRSATYNTRKFLTPIEELGFTHVTEAEARAYNMWREGYQRNWSNFFDPIAVRIEIDGKRILGDVTVMPLIAGTDYAEFLDLVRGAKVAPHAGDPHEGTILHWILAIDAASALAKEGDNILSAMVGAGASPLSWMGQSVAVYLDQDPAWEEARKSPEPHRFFENNLHRLPLGIHVEVKDAVKCALFLAAVRVFVGKTAPNMVEWETLKHGEQEYVRIGPSAKVRAQGGAMGNFALYYATLPDALVLTPSESLLKRALDRRAPPPKGEEGGPRGPKAEIPPWLGDHLCATVDRAMVGIMDHIAGPDDSYRGRMRRASWSNLWILNEWKRLFPDDDPVEVHEKVFGARLVCPGGGRYAWNEAWRTMESTEYGHPGEPKEGPEDALPFAGWRGGRFGLTFEKDGLRARCELTKE